MVNIPPEEFDPKYWAIGTIVINWAFVEEMVNDCVLFFYHLYGGKNLSSAKKGIPKTQFKRKLSFLEDCLKQLPELTKYKDGGFLLITRCRILCNERDNIIHSVVCGLAPDSILFVKHKYEKNSNEPDKPKLHSSEYTLNELLLIGKKMQDLAMDWIPYIHHFLKDQGIRMH